MFKVLLLPGGRSSPQGCVPAWQGTYPGAEGAQQVGSYMSHPASQPQLKPGWDVALIPIPCVVRTHTLFPFLFPPRGDLEVIYPELGDVSCMYIPKCHQYRRRISREWGSPRVRYPQAEKVSPESRRSRGAALAPRSSVLIKDVAGSRGRNSLGKDCLPTRALEL